MRRRRTRPWAFGTMLAMMALLGSGCIWRSAHQVADSELDHYKKISSEIEYTDIHCDDCPNVESLASPITIETQWPPEYWNLSLEEAIHLALVNSKVLRDLGGLVLQSPEAINTIHDPAIQAASPRFGMEAALSAFDAAWSTQAFLEDNDRAINNRFFGGGTRDLKQDLLDYTSEISKRAATGTEYTARHNTEYDFNNAPGNNDPNLPWMTNFEAEVRQPVLQGYGVNFNRIAGPDAIPGLYNGILVARVNNDISLADFELGVRDLINDVELAYWELYYGYRDLDSKIEARDRALRTWRRVQTWFVTGRRGGEAEKEAQAREQYFRLEAEVQNALSGAIQERSRPTTFRGTGGIYQNERRLRLMIGVPINDGRLIRPCDEPTLAKVHFNWHEAVAEALLRRPELRRQKWQIKRREMELIASKNFLLPRLDAIGRYRWRGLGHDLIEPNGSDRPRFNDAFQNLFDGDYQEWALGFEFSFPVGFRRAHAAVRHVQLQLAREHAILCEQERQISHDLSAAISEKDRAYELAQTNLNRRTAASDELEALEAVLTAEAVDQNQIPRLLDQLLDAQRRLAEAESRHFRSLVEYMLAIRRVHYSKGSLLDYNEVFLSEGAWPKKAYSDAMERDKLRLRSWSLTNFVKLGTPIVGSGTYPQQIGPPGMMQATEPLPPGESVPAGTPLENPRGPTMTPTPGAAEPLPVPHAEVITPATHRLRNQFNPTGSGAGNLAPIIQGTEYRKAKDESAPPTR